MTLPLPTLGEFNWGSDLNAVLAELQSRTDPALLSDFTLPVEQRAAVAYGRVPAVVTYPPTVTITNNLVDQDHTAIPGGKRANEAGWYTSVGPMNTTAGRWLGATVVNNPGDPFPDTYNVRATNVTTGTGATGAPTREVVVNGEQYVEFLFKQTGALNYRLMVDGQYINRYPISFGGTAGNAGSLLVNFGQSVTGVHLSCEFTEGRFYGINLVSGGTGSLAKPLGPVPKRLLVWGDSFTGGAGVVGMLSTFARPLGQLLGFRDVVSSGVGGTGYLATGVGATKYRDRIANDLSGLSPAPDFMVVSGGINDTGFSTSSLRTEVIAFLGAVRAALPALPIAVIGPFWPDKNTSNVAPQQTAIFSGAAAVDSTIPLIDTVTTPIFNDANYPRYDLDGTHPNQIGHDYLAHVLAAPLAQAGFVAA